MLIAIVLEWALPPTYYLLNPTYRFWSWAVVAMIVAGAMCRRCVAKSKSKGTVLNGHKISSIGCALFEGVVMLLLCQLQILTKKDEVLTIPYRYPIDTLSIPRDAQLDA